MSALISILIVGLIVYLIWYLVGQIVPGTPHRVIGIVLCILFLIWVVQRLGLISGLQL